ncbi:hypothetical protein BJ322DRAFT_162951 [Thelephora terrestris]|uniref:DUF3074 domain-containing protein n=1 Tax=Thelephora terrestris TaxID=56493 RepID=A0A9P6HA68_9AGAM|nr:hypothetical protein BJ322DRAFT_162951 [Thelephora terrestris]
MSQPQYSFLFSGLPIKLSEVPSEDAIIAAGKEILAASVNWKPGKTLQKVVKTSMYSPGSKDGKGGKKWACRFSEHTRDEGTFDDFWSGLGTNKAENEMQFIPEIKKVKLVKSLSPNAEIWTLYYELNLVMSPRVFTVLQVKQLGEVDSMREGVVVSIPINLSSTEDEELAALEEKGVKGRYASVEHILELPDDKVEWRMATSSSPGGLVPQFVNDLALPGAISKDVPLFLGWMQAKKATAENAT